MRARVGDKKIFAEFMGVDDNRSAHGVRETVLDADSQASCADCLYLVQNFNSLCFYDLPSPPPALGNRPNLSMGSRFGHVIAS